MTPDDRILSLNEKIYLLAQDIYDAAHISNSLKLEHFLPSKQIQKILDDEEYRKLISYLYKNDILSFAYREVAVGVRGRNAPMNGFHLYTIVINQPNIRRLLGLKQSADKPVELGARLHPEYAYLIINGKEIPLGKGKLHKSLQYWICRMCLKKPQSPVQETDIMTKYAVNYEIDARGRAVRDAVYKLNPKIMKATGIDELFTYSNGYVIFNADKLK